MKIVVLLAMVHWGSSFTVYDCTGNATTTWALDLHEPARCQEASRLFRETQEVRVQVLQTETRRPVKAYNCRATITKEVCRCGFESIHYGCQKPVLFEPQWIAPEDCRQAVKSGQLRVKDTVLEVTVGVKGKHAYYSHGHLKPDGTCETTAFHSGGIYFSKSYERTEVEYVVQVVRGLMDQATNVVRFTNGLRGPYPDGVMRDGDAGLLVWEILDANCSETVQSVYLGKATLHIRANNTNVGSLVIVEKEEAQQYAGLHLKSTTSVCQRHGYSTQLAGVVVVVLRTNDEPIQQAQTQDVEAGTHAHLQAQLAYLHLGSYLSAEDRFAALWTELCELERRTLFHKLQAIASASSPYSLLDNYGPGHTVVVAGATAYVLQCAPLDAGPRTYPNCTQEIPVTVLAWNASRFADPLTMILKDFPTVIPCDDKLPVRWKVDGSWMCATPRTTDCNAPLQLTPEEPVWQPLDPTKGLGGGLYTQEQLKAHEQFLMTQESRRAVVGKITLDAVGGGGPGRALGPPLSTADLEVLTHTIGGALFPVFRLMGTYWSYLVGFLLIFSIIKVVMGVLLRVGVLWMERGCGCWLWTALWHTAFLVARIPWVTLRTVARQVLRPVPGGPLGGNRDPEAPRDPEDGSDAEAEELAQQPYLTLREQLRVIRHQARRERQAGVQLPLLELQDGANRPT